MRNALINPFEPMQQAWGRLNTTIAATPQFTQQRLANKLAEMKLNKLEEEDNQQKALKNYLMQAQYPTSSMVGNYPEEYLQSPNQEYLGKELNYWKTNDPAKYRELFNNYMDYTIKLSKLDRKGAEQFWKGITGEDIHISENKKTKGWKTVEHAGKLFMFNPDEGMSSFKEVTKAGKEKGKVQEIWGEPYQNKKTGQWLQKSDKGSFRRVSPPQTEKEPANKKLSDLSKRFDQAIGRARSAHRGVGQYIADPHKEEVARESYEQALTVAIEYHKEGGDPADLGITPGGIRALVNEDIISIKTAKKALRELFKEYFE